MEHLRSPVAKDIAAWVQMYQWTIEQPRLEYQQMKPIEVPEEANLGQRELEMPNKNSNIVQNHLSELVQ